MHIVDSDLMQSKLTSACMHLIIASKLSHLDVGGLHALTNLTTSLPAYLLLKSYVLTIVWAVERYPSYPSSLWWSLGLCGFSDLTEVTVERYHHHKICYIISFLLRGWSFGGTSDLWGLPSLLTDSVFRCKIGSRQQNVFRIYCRNEGSSLRRTAEASFHNEEKLGHHAPERYLSPLILFCKVSHRFLMRFRKRHFPSE